MTSPHTRPDARARPTAQPYLQALPWSRCGPPPIGIGARRPMIATHPRALSHPLALAGCAYKSCPAELSAFLGTAVPVHGWIESAKHSFAWWAGSLKVKALSSPLRCVATKYGRLYATPFGNLYLASLHPYAEWQFSLEPPRLPNGRLQSLFDVRTDYGREFRIEQHFPQPWPSEAIDRFIHQITEMIVFGA